MSTPPHAIFQAVGRIAQECEESILGYERMPPALLLKQTEWRPDESGDYCAQCGCTHRPQDSRCEWKGRYSMPCTSVIRLGVYQEPLSTWIREFKYGQWLTMGQSLGTLLGQVTRQVLEQTAFSPDVVLPVPMPFMRRQSRGLDHALVLARQVARETNLPMRRPIRQRGGPSLVSGPFSRRRRRQNPFRASARGKLSKGENILLVDDVLTTGSTCRAVCELLRSMGCGDIGLAVVSVHE